MSIYAITNEPKDTIIDAYSDSDMLASEYVFEKIISDIEEINSLVHVNMNAVMTLDSILNNVADRDTDVTLDTIRYVESNIDNLVSISGYPDRERISVEEIQDPLYQLTLSIESGRSIITAVVAEIRKAYSRISNLFLRYITNITVFIRRLFTHISSVRKKLKELEKSGVKTKDDIILDENILGLNSLRLAAMLNTKDNDIFKLCNNLFDIYGDGKFIHKAYDLLLNVTKDGGRLSDADIFKDDISIKDLRSGILNKISRLFCKTNDGDQIIVGYYGRNIIALERCKPLRITASFMPFTYKIINIPVQYYNKNTFSFNGFKSPTYKEMYILLDKAEKALKDSKEIHDDIYDMFNIGSKIVNDMDENMNYEDTGIYTVMPEILMALAGTYDLLPTVVNAVGNIVIQSLEDY